MHVLVFRNKLISLGKFDGIEEVGKIFVNLDSVLLQGESPFFKILLKHNLGADNDNSSYDHVVHWEGPVYIKID